MSTSSVCKRRALCLGAALVANAAMTACGSGADPSAVDGGGGPIADGGPSLDAGSGGSGPESAMDGGAGTGGLPGTGGVPAPPTGECGNGIVEPGEDCDNGDANGPGTGCEEDCTFTCAQDIDCSDSLFCNGEEVCNEDHVCEPGIPPPDGSTCGQDRVCQAGSCVPTPNVCGDGILHSSEECDDGNLIDGDGCDSDCRFSCVRGDPARECRSTDPCRRNGTCGDDHVCVPGSTFDDGWPCGTDRECHAGECTSEFCGNGVVDPGEDCDDGNVVGGDGCENDCTFTCADTSDCSNACVEGSTCEPGGTGQLCSEGTPVTEGTACGTDRICVEGDCRSAGCGDGFVDTDAGEECEPPNTPTCNSNCESICDLSGQWAAHIELDLSWPSGGVATLAGSGKLEQWLLVEQSQSGTSLPSVATVCDLEVPDFEIAVPAIGLHEQYGFVFDVDPSRIEPREVTSNLDGLKMGASFNSGRLTVLLGLTLPDAENASWPDLEAAKDAAHSEHHDQSYDGFIGALKTEPGYEAVRVSVEPIFDPNRASHLFFAMRQTVRLAGTVDGTSCDAISGSATVVHLDRTVVGCLRTDGTTECDGAETEFLNENAPVYQVDGATFRMKRLDGDATCQDARSAVF